MPETNGRSWSGFVRGLPQAQGSSRAFRNAKTGQPILVSKTRNVTEWRQAIRFTLCSEWQGAPIDGAVGLSLIFVFPRPKSAKKGKIFHTTRPDGSKLLRAAEDAMTGVAYVDDSRVMASAVVKLYGDEPGVHILLREVEETAEAAYEFYLEHGQRVFDLVKGVGHDS